ISTHLDEDALKELAKAAGGEDHYFYADPRGFKVEAVVKALARLKEGNLDERVESIPSEAYQFLLFPGFMLLLVEACLADRQPEKKEQTRAGGVGSGSHSSAAAPGTRSRASRPTSPRATSR